MKNISDHDFSIGGELIDLASSDKAYLARCKLEVDEQLQRCKAQVASAKRTFAAGGQAANRDWLERAEGAIRVMGKASQVIQARLAEINEERKLANARTMIDLQAKKNDPKREEEKQSHALNWTQAFVEAARETLPKDQFLSLCRMAHQTVGLAPRKQP